ncbi:hypothetical protein H4R24_001588 [Coemansia sp. RSA 988]|nr:hypothetical protein H4R24_001588 [Coemansia sp. RSA 988]
MLDEQPLEDCAVPQHAPTHNDHDTPCPTHEYCHDEQIENRLTAAQQLHAQQPQAIAEETDTHPAVVSRMLELEGAIALVKSSLDSHTSSYYSVASQIAELNARISHLGIQDRSINIDEGTSINNQLHCSLPFINGAATETSATVEPRIYAHDCNADVQLEDTGNSREDSGGDEQYARIQEMVDSLIKDANLALNCKPDDFPCGIGNAINTHTEETQYAPELEMSQSSEPDETATLVMDDISGRQSRFTSVSGPPHSISRPVSRGANSLLHATAFPSLSTRGTPSHIPRGRKPRPSVLLPIPPLADDPSEADAESDSELGLVSTISDRQSLYRNRPRTSHYQSQRSRRRKVSEYPRSHSSRGVRNMERYRSDTTGSFQWNSSETCASPGVTEPTESKLTPTMVPSYTQSHSVAKSISTPTRRTHFGPESCSSFAGLDNLSPQADHPVPNTQNFPCLSPDEQLWHNQGVYASDSLSEDRGDSFLYRDNYLDTGAAPRSASYVDERMSDNMAALQGSRRRLDEDYAYIRQEARARSNTYNTESSQTTAVPADAYAYGSLHSSLSNVNSRECVPKEALWKASPRGFLPGLLTANLPHDRIIGRTTYRSASSHYMATMHHRSPIASKSVAGFLSLSPVKRRPNSSRKYAESSGLNDLEFRRTDTMVSDIRESNGPGLLSMFSLLYWTLLFTLGALMLDSFLCQMAGKRVMGTVGKMAHAETNDLSSPEDTSSSESFGKRDKTEHGSEYDGNSGSTNLTSTVGRFVRWYVEDSEHISASNEDCPQARIERPRSLRMRKASAMRGSFKHIG